MTDMKQQNIFGKIVETENTKDTCKDCNNKYKQIGIHWSKSDKCSPPNLTNKQKELIVGLMMGDGSRQKQNRKNLFRVDSTTKPFLKWVSNKFDGLSNKIYMRKGEENYLKNYRWTTKHTPELNTVLDKWYISKGESQIPSEISLTPLILKMWYCSDGGLDYNDGYFNRIQIRNRSQENASDFFSSLFEDIGFDIFYSSERIRVPRNDTERFFDYIGEPPTASQAGFAYKWQYQDYDEYQRLKNIHDKQNYDR